MNQIDLKGRVAVVTGGAQGIGYAVAERFIASGANVVLWDIDAPLLAQAKGSLGAAASTAQVELTDAGAVAAATQAALSAHGRIDILVNNAGITGGNAPTWELAPDAWRRTIDVNLVAPYLTCHAIVPAMINQGYGRIVNVASLAGLVPGTPGHTLYAAAKSYLIKLSESLALENRGHGIHVSACCPGFTQSEFHDVVGVRQAMAGMPRWMWLQADEVARESLDAVERGKVVVVNGRVYRLIRTLAKLMPDSLALALTARRARSFRRTQ